MPADLEETNATKIKFSRRLARSVRINRRKLMQSASTKNVIQLPILDLSGMAYDNSSYIQEHIIK